MSEFKLDARLHEDSILLGDLTLSQLRLMDNALLPWFILVPRRSIDGQSVTEFHNLAKDEQTALLNEINMISEFLSDEYQPDKINIATIGNIVSQLHVHIIGRYMDDFCWPNVVWGQDQKKPYTPEGISQIRQKVVKNLGDRIKPSTSTH